jgi:hypothetical protein
MNILVIGANGNAGRQRFTAVQN